VIYLSIPTKGRTGKSIHEIWRYTLNNQGQVVMKEQVTRNSEKNNVRPFVLPGSEGSPLRLMWMHGDYAYWIVKKGYPTGFPTAIHAHLPKGRIPCQEVSKASKGAFTIDVSMQLPADHYHGTLLTTQSFNYGLDKESVKPYVEMGGNRYYSTNQLYTSDNWATNCTGTHGDNWPTPHAKLRITFTYDGNHLTVYRNGLIDQVIEVRKLKASQVNKGDIPGCSINVESYDRCLPQEELQAQNK
jgi:hypothetical protein